MTYRQIETSREIRLWLGQIILPIATVVMLVPESRNVVVTKFKEAKKVIETKFQKN